MALDAFPHGYQASWTSPDGTMTERIVEVMATFDGPRPYQREIDSPSGVNGIRNH